MSVERITPRQARERQAAGVRLIDLREPHERASGQAEGAEALALAEIERDPVLALGNGLEHPVMLICQTGARSARAAQALAESGYRHVATVQGGTADWIAQGLPVVHPQGDADFYERYSRHLRLPEVGEAGQRRLQQARVALVGAGGLGSPVALYLAAAGVGTLLLADDDLVDRSNLQRQILHTESRIGQPKVESAQVAIAALNPAVETRAWAQRITGANVDELVGGADVVVDGGDNFPVRYLLNDACIRWEKPLVYGAVQRFQGQVSVFDAGRRRGRAPCYRCLFPEPPSPETAPNCAEAGVLGVLPGVIGLLQATEAIKLLLGLGEALAGRLLHFDALSMRFRESRLVPDPDCPACAPGRKFRGYPDYVEFCSR